MVFAFHKKDVIESELKAVTFYYSKYISSPGHFVVVVINTRGFTLQLFNLVW